MIEAQLKNDFLPKEIVIKLHRDLDPLDYKSRIKLVNQYAESIKSSFDDEVYQIKLNQELALLYWQGNQFHSAIEHYEQVVYKLQPEQYPMVYFHTIAMLCRCNRLIADYQQAHKWINLAFEQIHLSDSSFDNLYLLKEYADLILDYEISFDNKHIPIIKSVIKDLEFPELSLKQPLETIQFLSKMNSKWNRELSRISLMPGENIKAILSELKKYVKSCEIGWYRNYANKRIANLKQ